MPQVIVSDGKVVSINDDTEDLYARVPQVAGSVFFDFAGALATTTEMTINESVPVIIEEDGVIRVETQVVQRPISVAVVPDDPRASMTLVNAKAATINCLQKITRAQILAQYPTQLQMDITNQVNGHNATSLNNMKTFIDGRYTVLNTKTSAVNALATLEDVLAYNVWA